MIDFYELEDSPPYKIFKSFYELAISNGQRGIHAICISSYDANKDIVNSRYVNLKHIVNDKWFFYSNYNSPKAKEFRSHKQISGVFYWEHINVQIRIKANIFKASDKESDLHFNNRSIEKNALSISSNQSSEIVSFSEIKKNYKLILQKISRQKQIRRPNYWGGYSFIPYEFEFWEGDDFRLNRRLKFTQDQGLWQQTYLQP